MDFIYTFMNGILPDTLTNGVKVMINILVLVHVLIFLLWVGILIRDVTRPKKALDAKKIEEFQKKNQ
jgi:hypothetical protein